MPLKAKAVESKQKNLDAHIGRTIKAIRRKNKIAKAVAK